MPNNYLSVLYKQIIQVENKNVGLKVGWGIYIYIIKKSKIIVELHDLFNMSYVDMTHTDTPHTQ